MKTYILKAFNFFKLMFVNGSGVSIKRLTGFIGWITCIFIVIYCTIVMIQAPLIAELLFYCSTALLGLDTVMRPFGNKPKDHK